MLVKKKTCKICVWVDFRDLNNVYPKYNFSFPITKIMIDGTISHERLTFMDGSSGYNQIWMVPTDEEKIAFQTLKVIYCHEVISFGLMYHLSKGDAEDFWWYALLTGWMLYWWPRGEIKRKGKSFAKSLFGIWTVTLILTKNKRTKICIWCVIG